MIITCASCYRGPLPLGQVDTNERVVCKRGRRGLVVTVKTGSQNGQVGMGRGRAEGVVRKGGSMWAWHFLHLCVEEH